MKYIGKPQKSSVKVNAKLKKESNEPQNSNDYFNSLKKVSYIVKNLTADK
jgi:hypothetical protein